MRLGIPLYRQTTDFTCGACATLMVWKYFDKRIHASKQNEFLIWSETAALPFKFSSPYRIAAFFTMKGFETRLVMEQGMGGEGKTPLECCRVNTTERQLFLKFFRATILRLCSYGTVLAMPVTRTIGTCIFPNRIRYGRAI